MISYYKKFHLLKITHLILIFLITYSVEGFCMSLLNKPEEEVVLCSPMEGTITLNKKPAIGAKIERLIKWKDNTGENDITLTDDHGKFKLPLKKEKATLSKISQFVVAQEIRVYYQDEEYLIWTMGKMSKKLYGELNGKPLNFHCELTDEDESLRFENSLLVTKCKWDSIEPQTGE